MNRQWKRTEGYGKPVRPSDRTLPRQRMATAPKVARAVEELLRFFSSFPVALFLHLWRTTLIRCASSISINNSLPDIPLPGVRSGPLDPRQLGMLGDLRTFSSKFLPPRFLQVRLPLTKMHWQQASYPQRVELSEMSIFLTGSVFAGQVDVFQTLVQEMGLEISSWRSDLSVLVLSRTDTFLHVSVEQALPADIRALEARPPPVKIRRSRESNGGYRNDVLTGPTAPISHDDMQQHENHGRTVPCIIVRVVPTVNEDNYIADDEGVCIIQ